MTEALNTAAPGDAQAVIDVTRQGVPPVKLSNSEIYAFPTPDGIEVIDGRAYADWPTRKTGRFTAFTAASFATYTAEQAEEGTKVWVDDSRFTAVAVLNGHRSDSLPGHGDHLITLQLKPSESWQAWLAVDGKLLSQTEFAELIEDNSPDIVQPTAAEMLELAQSFQATTKVDFESSKFLADGRRSLEYKETVDAKAGRRGQLEIPTEFHLALKPFIGSEVYRVTARFRYRITDGHLRIGYKLNRPADIQRAAFDDVIAAIATKLSDGQTILDGKPS